MTQPPQGSPQPHRDAPDQGEFGAQSSQHAGERPVSGDRAASAQGVAPREQSHDNRTARATDPSLDAPKKRGISGTVWAALILGVIILILLLIFIIQNNVSTRFEYMAWQFSLPLGVAMLLSAIAGALIMGLVGSVRMFTLSHRLRKLEKERARIQSTLNH